MPLPRRQKHPSAIRAVPFRVLRLPTGITIGTVSATATPGGLTIGSVTASGNEVTVMCSGGTAPTVYQIECEINLSNGEKLIGECELEIVNP